MAGRVWVWIPDVDGTPDGASLEALAVGRRMAEAMGAGLTAVGARAAEGGPGVSRAAYTQGSRAFLGRRAAKALLARSEFQSGVDVFLLPEGPEAADLAAGLAGALGCGLVSHCADVERAGDEWRYLVPAFGGMAAIACPGRRPELVSLTPGARFGGRPVDAAGADLKAADRLEVELPAAGPGDPEVLDGPAAGDTGRASGAPGGGAPGLGAAKLVVAGGAGVGDADGWRLVADLAAVLGAGLGATRPVVDEDWAPADLMIGQSGQRVKPAVYVAVGISGDLQHLVGVGEGTTVLAVNHDPVAPILGRADYAVVADLRTFLPVLIRKVRERKTPA